MIKLFEPINVGTLQLKNRIVMSPMCMYECKNEDGRLTPFHEAHYASRAIGQVGLIFLEATAVEKRGRISKHDLGIWNDGQGELYKKLVETLHRLGSKAGIQLAHAGRKAEDEPQNVGPSALSFSDRYQTPKALSVEGIEQVIQQFKKAARRSEEAGFDAVEIHAAHGYLLNQFISPLSNSRSDEYGKGTLENRYRFLKNVIQEVKQTFSGNIWVRISADEYEEKGTTKEEFTQLVQWMTQDGVDVVDVSTGGVVATAPKHVYPGYQTPYASHLKANTNCKVTTVGKLGDPALASYILESGQADLIALARPLLREPNWAYRAAKELQSTTFVPFNGSYGRGYTE